MQRMGNTWIRKARYLAREAVLGSSPSNNSLLHYNKVFSCQKKKIDLKVNVLS